MALTSTFGFTNVVANATKPIPIDIQPLTNYAKVEDEPTSCVLNNKTCPLDQGELVTYRSNELAKVTCSQELQNPAAVRNGVQYVIKVEDVLRTKDANGVVIMDEPVVAYLTIRHQKSGNITSAHIEQVVSRVLGACMFTDGTWRFNDLMRSAVTPSKN